MLSTSQARAFYDRFGARQDEQAFYEDPALDELVAHASFDEARAVVELGCGTGRLAARLLADHLPEEANYRAFDQSSTMVALARERLDRYPGRASVELTGGGMALPLPDACCDRYVSTYVADLLPAAEIRALVADARRLLAPGGLLCLVGLAPGEGLAARAVTVAWRLVHRLRPAAVGGCRPLDMLPFLADWEIGHHRKVVAWGLTSEVVVARPGSVS